MVDLPETPGKKKKRYSGMYLLRPADTILNTFYLPGGKSLDLMYHSQPGMSNITAKTGCVNLPSEIMV